MEFFLSLFFVTGGISIELSEKRFSSISDILFKISFVRVTLITCSTSISSIYYIVLRIVFPLKLHYFFTIFHYFIVFATLLYLNQPSVNPLLRKYNNDTIMKRTPSSASCWGFFSFCSVEHPIRLINGMNDFCLFPFINGQPVLPASA